MNKTKNSLASNVRGKIAALLNERLADAVDLYTQCKQAHWNVRGDQFIALHELFDRTAAAVQGFTDMIAERIQQLGGVALGTARVAAKTSSLREYPLEAADGKKHIEALSSALAEFGGVCRKGIGAADNLGDAVTADLLTEVTRGIDEQLWFIEAHQK